MKDLTSPNWIKLKGGLFLLLGSGAAALLVLECATWKVALLLALTIWGFCRFYYFAFYVIEHYVDAGYRFAGLVSLFRHLIRSRRKD